MIEGQHRMRLTTAKVGLELHYRIAALASKAFHRADQHALQTLSEIGAAQALDRIFVFVRAHSAMDLPQIGRELGLLIATAPHVLPSRHNLAPRPEVTSRLAPTTRAPPPSPFL